MKTTQAEGHGFWRGKKNHTTEQRCNSDEQKKAEMPHASDSPSVAYQSICSGKNSATRSS